MSDTGIRERLAELVDPLPIDLQARLVAVRTGRPKGPTHRWVVAAFALSLAAAAVAFAIWAFTAGRPVRPSAVASNGRIAFSDYAPGQEPSAFGGVVGDTDIYTMNPDGTDVRRVTTGPQTDSGKMSSWSPDGSRLAFVRLDGKFGPANVFVVRSGGTGTRQITSCRLAGCVQSVAWSPRGDAIAYVRGRDIYVIHPDGSDNRLIYRCDCLFIDLSWSPDGNQIAFTGTRQKGYPGLLFLIDSNGTNRRLIDRCDSRLCHGGDRDSAPSWSPNGEWVAFSRERNIWLVRPDGNGLHQLTDCPKVYRADRLRCSDEGPIWSPDGSKIAFQGHDGIYVMNADGSDAIRIREQGYVGSWQPVLTTSGPTPSITTPVPPRNRGLVFERVPSCGTGLCSEDRGDPAIVVSKSDGSNVRAIGRGTEPAWSPEGQRIAFKGLDGALYVMRRDGTGVTRIFDCHGPECHGMNHPRWSPDGTRLAFEGAIRRDGALRWEIYVVGADGSYLRRVTSCERPACAEHTSPAWAPDGSTIAFVATEVQPKSRAEVYGTDILTVDLATGTLRTVYRCPPGGCTFQGGVDWSPDGSRIVFGLGSGLTVIDADGSNPRQLTSAAHDYFPSWSPDGRVIAFTRYPGGVDAGIHVVDVDSGRIETVVPGSNRWGYLFPSWERR